MTHDTTADRKKPFHTREGLARHLNATIKRPTVLTRRAFDALTDGERAVYNQSRLDYISGGLVVRTPEMVQADKLVAKAKLASSQRPLSANGLIVSGPPTVGKTTVLMALMKTVWTRSLRESPDPAGERVPVVYIEVPSGSTGRLLMAEFAEFFGITATRYDTKDMLERRVLSMLYEARSELIVIDEIHNLEAANRGNGESIDALKVLRDKVHAEFVFAGIELETSALLMGKRGGQISGRFTQLEMDCYDLNDPDEASIFGGIVDAFEKALPLTEHKPGTLGAMVPYLHDRTNGNFSSLNMLLTGAANDLINDADRGREAITKKLLDEQLLDITAERHYKKVRNNIPSRKNTKKESKS